MGDPRRPRSWTDERHILTQKYTQPNPGPNNVKELRAGDSLVINQRLTSPSGKYWLVLDGTDKFCLCNSGGVVWDPNYVIFSHMPVVSVTLSSTGELTVLQKDKTAVWSSNSGGKATQDAVLLVQDDGHAVILSNGERVWYTYRQKDGSTDKDRLVAGEWLASGQALISPSGNLSLVLQRNGDLVLSKSNKKLWSPTAISETLTEEARVILRDDDNLWIEQDDQPVWTSKTRRKKSGGNAVLRIAEAEDGGAAILESDGIILWSTKSSLIQAWEPQKVSFRPYSPYFYFSGC